MKPSERINEIMIKKGISPLDGEYKRFQAIVSYLDEQYEKNKPDPYNYELPAMKVKEPQWPKKVYTYKSLPSRKDYRTGFNAARDLCKQAWKDEKERTPGIPGKQDKYV